MFARIALALILGLCATAPALAQGPIPSIEVPEQFSAPVDGYSMAVPYQLWRNWIEREKGPITEQALERPDILDDRRAIGLPLFTAAFHNDYGRYASVEVRIFCTKLAPARSEDWGECNYIYRRAHVPISANYRGETNALDVWMRANFDPALVARNLRAAGTEPDENMWGQQTIFDGAPSPRTMLAEHLEIVRVESRECPGLRTAMEAVEGTRPDWGFDFLAVGNDTQGRPPPPHATTVTYTMNFRVAGQRASITGDSALHPLLGPVLRAVRSCETAQRAARS